MSCTKRRAEESSSGKFLRVLRLVSISSTIESGRADSLLNTAIFCGLPSSLISKLPWVSPATGAPCSSAMLTNTLTSLTSTLMVVELSGGASLGLAAGVALEVELEREAGFAVPDPPLAHGGLGTGGLGV